MKLWILAVVLTALALGGCSTSGQPRPAAKPTPTSTVGAWHMNLFLINQVGAAGTASFTFADGHTKVVDFTEAGQDLTEKDLVLVGQSVSMAVKVTKLPKNSYIVCSIAAFELTVATEGAGTLVSNTGTRTGTFTCAWSNDGTLLLPKPEE